MRCGDLTLRERGGDFAGGVPALCLSFRIFFSSAENADSNTSSSLRRAVRCCLSASFSGSARETKTDSIDELLLDLLLRSEFVSSLCVGGRFGGLALLLFTLFLCLNFLFTQLFALLHEMRALAHEAMRVVHENPCWDNR